MKTTRQSNTIGQALIIPTAYQNILDEQARKQDEAIATLKELFRAEYPHIEIEALKDSFYFPYILKLQKASIETVLDWQDKMMAQGLAIIQNN
jgi:hypothetical protein